MALLLTGCALRFQNRQTSVPQKTAVTNSRCRRLAPTSREADFIVARREPISAIRQQFNASSGLQRCGSLWLERRRDRLHGAIRQGGCSRLCPKSCGTFCGRGWTRSHVQRSQAQSSHAPFQHSSWQRRGSYGGGERAPDRSMAGRWASRCELRDCSIRSKTGLSREPAFWVHWSAHGTDGL